MHDISIITTEDGSHSLLNTSLQETYHSVHGAVQESQYVFIRHGLDYWLKSQSQRKVRILEVGFGTGLNALLTWLYGIEHQLEVVYYTWETRPLSPEITRQLNYANDSRATGLFNALHQSAWNKEERLSENFVLCKVQDSILTGTLLGGPFDIVYHDAFAPSKQPEMWALGILKKVTDALSPRGVWVTYCARGQVKRDLISLDLRVEKLPGPPGKREMLRAIRERSLTA